MIRYHTKEKIRGIIIPNGQTIESWVKFITAGKISHLKYMRPKAVKHTGLVENLRLYLDKASCSTKVGIFSDFPRMTV